MRRAHAVLFGLGALLASALAAGQESPRIYRVAAILTTSPLAEMAGPDPEHPMIRAFVHELRALGYVEGRNLVLERRSALGRPETYPGIIAELLRLRTDVIVTAGGGALFKRVKGVWDAVPVVTFGADDPVPHGFAASLAHPGGNLTGLMVMSGPENAAKRLQLLKEAVPSVSRVAYLATKRIWEHPITRQVRGVAPALGIDLLFAEHLPDDLEASFARIERMHPDALFVSIGAESFGQRKQIVRFAVQAGLPGSYPFALMAEDGGLMAYSVRIADLGRGAAHYVDKILKGARPGDLPIEGPAKLDLVINLRAARALGLTIPKDLLLQADRVIE